MAGNFAKNDLAAAFGRGVKRIKSLSVIDLIRFISFHVSARSPWFVEGSSRDERRSRQQPTCF